MVRRLDSFHYWQGLTIKKKFRVAFGILIVFLALMAGSSTMVLNVLQNRAIKTLELSGEIQSLVEGMNLNLYKARNLEKDFFLWYPRTGYSTAHRKYAQAAADHTENIEKLSLKLQNLIAKSDVSDAWNENLSSLNLFISSAKRHAHTVQETETLIAMLAADKTGLQDKLARISAILAETFKSTDVRDVFPLFQQIQLLEKEYLATRQRPYMQSAFNLAIPLKEAITLAPSLEVAQKKELLLSLDTYLSIAGEIVTLDVAIHSKFKEFDLESEAINPVTEQLFTLANLEIEHAYAQTGKRGRLSIVVILATTLLGLLLSSLIALILSKSITANVLKLTTATRDFHAGNQEARTHIHCTDEFGELGKSFNAMADSLQAHVKNLEQQVTERTSQLTTANTQLSEEITERKNAENQLRMERDKLEAIFEGMTDGIYIVSEEYEISYVNPVLVKDFGEYEGRKCYEYFHDRSEPCSWCKKDNVFAGETVRWEWTSEENGKIYDIIDTRIINSDKTLSKLQIFRDITEQEKMKEQLLLHEKLVTIAGLAAGVAHEINTPLSAILQAHQLVAMGLSPEEEYSKEKAAECGVDLVAVQDYFKKNELDFFMNGIRESALMAGNIIKSLLEFSRPHEGSFSTVNLQDIIESSVLLSLADFGMKKEYRIADVQISKEFGQGCPSVVCVAAELEQVILNLIKNSVLSMAADEQTKKPCIILRTFTTTDNVVIEVEDNGPGIPGEILNNIFDPFFTTREVGKGTGLGLSVAHAIIVDKHKGKIRVESESGQGAKFIVELPLHQA